MIWAKRSHFTLPYCVLSYFSLLVLPGEIEEWSNQSFPFSETIPIPTVNQYLYFLFAPTLIYRDNYPRYLFREVEMWWAEV